jgi:serine/threonine protein kinase
MIVHFMCFARLPYSSAEAINADAEDVDALRAEIVAWAGFDATAAPSRGRSDLPERLYAFLKRLLALDPDERPSTEEILRGIGAGPGAPGADEDPLPPPFPAHSGRNPRIKDADSPTPPRNRAPQHTSPVKSPLQHHHHPLTLDGDDDSGGAAPQEPSAHGTGTAVVRRRRDTPSNHDASPPAPSSPAPVPVPPSAPRSPVLALPPPPAPLRMRLRTLLLPPRDLPPFAVLRLALFVAKYLSLTTPCTPLAPRPQVAYPLLVLAAAEAVLRVDWRWAVGALAVHFAVLGIVGGSGGLCAWGDGV